MNYTCRYCPDCDLLIPHKHEIEHYLVVLFLQTAPDVIGNDYLAIGTVEKKCVERTVISTSRNISLIWWLALKLKIFSK